MEIITVGSEGTTRSRRYDPVLQMNLVLWDYGHFIRGLLAESTIDHHILTDARKMADFIGVPLDENYLPWDKLEPFYVRGRKVLRIWGMSMALFWVFFGIAVAMNLPPSKEIQLIGFSVVTLNVLAVLGVSWLEKRSRGRAIERSRRNSLESRQL